MTRFPLLDRHSHSPAAFHRSLGVACFSLALGPLLGLFALLLWSGVGQATVPNWPEIYDPFTVQRIDLKLSAQDWNTVLHDQTFNIEVPAYLKVPGEDSVLVALRRKSSLAFPSESNPQKVGLKIDVNEYIPQSWHKLKKISLENGGESGLLHEGFAWFLHRLAWTSGSYPYMPGLGCWVKLYVNGTFNGCFVNAEQVDKRFLENRGLWLDDDTWIYDASIGSHTIEFGGAQGSPNYNALCYSPFPIGSCATPSPTALAADLNNRIDMQGMLTLGAVNAWCYSPDNLFSKGKNHFYADFTYGKRYYYTWDMDANFGNLNATRSIYELGASPYEDLILDNPTFRTQYDSIMRALINGPFATASLIAAIDQLETVLLPALSTDPYNPVGASGFDDLREFVTARNANVASQLPSTVAVAEDPTSEGVAFTALAAQPNPFRNDTRIQYRLEHPGPVTVRVYDTRGALVKTLAQGEQPAGVHQVMWQGTDAAGNRAGAGLYFVAVESAGQRLTRRVTLLH